MNVANRMFSWLLSAGIALGAGLPAMADSGTFSTLSYNIAGLLEPFSSSNPDVNTPVMSCRIKGYSLVNVQEDFNYHAALYDTCDDHTHRSPTSGGMGIGSGLNTLSYLSYMDWYRGDWSACNGVDCLTPKGWTHARVRLAEGTYVSLYNLHTQAQVESADLAARRDNVLQLLQYIESQSPTDAIIVMGDTNTRYTRSGDNIREFLKHGFTDVWISKVRAGAIPAADDIALTSCADTTSASCEIVDKVLFRNNGHLALSALDYRVDSVNFRDAAGNQLSDHYPVSVNWNYATSSSFELSDPWGGPHGDAFNDVGLLPDSSAVSKLVLRAGERVDRVEVVLSNGYILSHGGAGGTEQSLTLAANEHLSSMQLCSGKHQDHTRIFYAKFATSAGRSLSGGSMTADCTTFTAPAGYQIAGFHGRSGAEVDKLGAVYTRVLSYTPGSARYFQIVNQSSGLCMDINNANMAPGTKVIQWPCNGANWQKWSYDAEMGLIRSLHDPRYCLDNSGRYDNGANIIIWACTGSANQRFTLDEAAGTLSVRSHPVQVIDAVGTAAGNDVITYGDWGGLNQRWSFVP